MLLMQVHLYSDGGIDVSQDGRYLLTCARVHIPPFYYEWQAGVSLKSALHTSTSPNSHPARVVSDEREMQCEGRLRGILRTTARPESTAGGSKQLSGAGTVNTVQPLPQAPPPPPPLFTPLNRRQQSSKGADNDRPSSAVQPSLSAAGSAAASNRVSPAPSVATQSSGDAVSSSEHLSSLLAGLALPPPPANLSATRTDGAPAVIDMTRRRLEGIPPRPPALLDPSAEDASEGWSDELQLKSSGCDGLDGVHSELSRMSQRRIVPQQRHKLIRMGDRPPLGSLWPPYHCFHRPDHNAWHVLILYRLVGGGSSVPVRDPLSE